MKYWAISAIKQEDEMTQIPMIRFKHRELANLRKALLTEDGKESYAVLFAKRETLGKTDVFTVRQEIRS